MTEKRFIFNSDTVATNLKTPIVYDNKIMNIGEVLEKLNELSDENEQLKQFQTNVFTLINEMIEMANLYRTPIKSLDYGDDLGYWNGVYQKLKELKEILEKDGEQNGN